MTKAHTTKATPHKSRGDFSKFLSKHADELQSVAALLGLLTRCIPMDPQNRKVANAVIAGLATSAERIASSAPDVIEGVIDPETIREAVAAKVPDMIGGLIEARVRDALNLDRDGAPKEDAAPAEGGGT